MTDEELDAIRARLAGATPGVWQLVHADKEMTIAIPDGHNLYSEGAVDSCSSCLHNATLIAHAPADLANLLAEVEQLRRVVGTMLADAETKQRMQQAQNEHMFALQDERTAAQAEVERLRAEVGRLRPAGRHAGSCGCVVCRDGGLRWYD